jgi:hypothetical protein
MQNGARVYPILRFSPKAQRREIKEVCGEGCHDREDESSSDS